MNVIKHTPLVSIDLIISRSDDRILLGHRLNEPASGYWFVPGGRIFKDESLATAFARICRDEIDIQYAIEDAKLKGCYEHFYQENFAKETGISTHYVVLAYQLTLSAELKILPTKLPNRQHDDYRWFKRKDILKDPAIHQNTRAYFTATKSLPR